MENFNREVIIRKFVDGKENIFTKKFTNKEEYDNFVKNDKNLNKNSGNIPFGIDLFNGFESFLNHFVETKGMLKDLFTEEKEHKFSHLPLGDFINELTVKKNQILGEKKAKELEIEKIKKEISLKKESLTHLLELLNFYREHDNTEEVLKITNEKNNIENEIKQLEEKLR